MDYKNQFYRSVLCYLWYLYVIIKNYAIFASDWMEFWLLSPSRGIDTVERSCEFSSSFILAGNQNDWRHYGMRVMANSCELGFFEGVLHFSSLLGVRTHVWDFPNCSVAASRAHGPLSRRLSGRTGTRRVHVSFQAAYCTGSHRLR